MKALRIAALLCVLAFFVFALLDGHTPHYEWHTVQSQTTPIDAGGLWTYGPLSLGETLGRGTNWGTQHTDKLHVQINATSPVTYALIPEKLIAAFRDKPDYLRNPRVLGDSDLQCVGTNIFQLDRECDVSQDHGGMYFVVYDPRDTPTASETIAAAGMAYLGASGKLQAMTSQNKVSVNLATWDCVRGCER